MITKKIIEMYINKFYYNKMTDMENKQLKWYAVIKGKVPGIYDNWDDTKQQVDGFSGAVFKSFTNKDEADEYYDKCVPEDWCSFALSNGFTPEEAGVYDESGVGNYMVKNKKKINLDCLSEKQTHAINLFKLNKNIFITGPGGSGKSFLIKTMVDICKQTGKNVQVCAMTGCAALLLDCGAKTVHSWGGIGLAKEPNHVIATGIDLNGRKKKNWRKVDVLIIDEVSMMSKKIFELIDLVAKKVRRNGLPFGGIQVVLSGDFFQLPPVKNNKEENTDSSLFCFESPLWNTSFHPNCQIEFTEIFRQKDKVYAKILNQIRKGKMSSNSIRILSERVGCGIDEESEIKPTILLPIKAMVEQINNTELEKLTGEIVEYNLETCSGEEIVVSEQDRRKLISMPASVVEKEKENLFKSVNSEKIINLKIGCQVMCTVNLDLDGEFPICNGSLGIVTRFIGTYPNLSIPVVKFNNGAERAIHKHIWKSDNIPGVGVKQIPLVLAWAITIHKSQGSTLDLAEIDVGNNIFEAGQTYVALSRVKELNGLFLKSFNPSRILINKKVKDFYKRLNENVIPQQDKTKLDAFNLLN